MNTPKPTPAIQRTVNPPERPPFNEWAKALKVSSRIPMQRHARK